MEILIVVVLLAILAAIAVPQLSNVSTQARVSMLKDDLRVLRNQLNLFKAQHRDVPPGYPECDNTKAPTEGDFVDQLTLASTAAGETAEVGTVGYPYGPYFSDLPPNPINDKSSVQVIPDNGTFPSQADNSHGWIYQPSTQTIRADASGVDEDGKAYFDY